MKGKKVKFDWMNWKGFNEVRKSDMMMNALLNEAVRVGDIEGNYVGISRCHVIVKENKND